VKLTTTKVGEIRLMHGQGIGPKELSHVFDVSRSQIGRVLRGQCWP
jgi:hypothetical protein